MTHPGYNDSVFINCPFDREFTLIFHAIFFAVYRCGFYPRTALDEDDSTENRISKIIRLIKECRYGIHDLSRIELSDGFPRFNMPFELGIFFGARYLGTKKQNNKIALVFERTRYNYQRYISDLSGIDPKAHNNNPFTAMESTVNWLRTASRRTTIPEIRTIRTEYQMFLRRLPEIVDHLGFEILNLPISEYRTIVEEFVREII